MEGLNKWVRALNSEVTQMYFIPKSVYVGVISNILMKPSNNADFSKHSL